MKEQKVTLEAAQLAHSKGCNEFSAPMPSLIFEEKYRPTQSLLQRWLREIHNIEVVPGPHFKKLSYGCEVYHYTAKNVTGYTPIELNSSETYEEALEEGLIEALKLI